MKKDAVTAKVFFANARSRNPGENKLRKIKKLFRAAKFANILPDGALTAVKLHFGERGNDSFVSPVLVRAVVDEIKKCGAKPFLTDTCTLYSGSRHNAVDHLMTAYDHGFTPGVVGAPVVIADGLSSENETKVTIKGKHFKSVRIAADVAAAKSMIVVSHFKGHQAAGFGGALKNMAMGCAPRRGKLDQHRSRFEVNADKCVGCAECYAVCPQKAVTVAKKKASIDKEKCIGCGECLTVCPEKAVGIDWNTEIGPFMERLGEYALGAAKTKGGRVGYFNFLLDITPDCDCVPWSDAAVVPDIGILASLDPVALDAASLDLVNRQAGLSGTHLTCNLAPGQDKFKGVWSYTQSEIALEHCQALGLGTRNYELVEIG